MSELQHTPGPWGHGVQAMQPVSARDWYAVQHVFDQEPFEGVLEEEWGVYPPRGHAGPVAIASGEANARLIAAAPEMLSLLKDWLNSFADSIEGGEEDELVKFTRSVLSKAGGQPSCLREGEA